MAGYQEHSYTDVRERSRIKPARKLPPTSLYAGRNLQVPLGRRRDRKSMLPRLFDRATCRATTMTVTALMRRWTVFDAR